MSRDETIAVEVEVLKELFRLETEGNRLPVTVGPFTAYMLVGLCQLGVKSLPAGDGRAEIFRRISADFEPFFSDTAAGSLIDASWAQVQAEGK